MGWHDERPPVGEVQIGELVLWIVCKLMNIEVF